ncbi:aminotransferase-like mobile domain-containing protein [Tanacetum coccineum]
MVFIVSWSGKTNPLVKSWDGCSKHLGTRELLRGQTSLISGVIDGSGGLNNRSERLIGGLGGWLSDGLSSRLGDKLGTGFNSRRGGQPGLADADRLQVVPLDEDEENQCIRLLSFCKRHSPNRSIERVAPDERMGQLPSHQSDILLFFQDVCRLMQAIKDHGRVRSDGASGLIELYSMIAAPMSKELRYGGLLSLYVCIRKCISSQFEVEADEVEDVFGNEDNDIANGALQVVLADPGILDCSICHEPLCTPVFQCQNGHLTCCLCCSKVETICPICYPLGYKYTRYRGLEVAIESIGRILCINETLAVAYKPDLLMSEEDKDEDELELMGKNQQQHMACSLPILTMKCVRKGIYHALRADSR